MARIDLMSIWFAAWNADIEAAREDYDRSVEALASGREYRDPEWCFKQLHRMTEDSVVPGTEGQCLECRRDGERFRKEKRREAA